MIMSQHTDLDTKEERPIAGKLPQAKLDKGLISDQPTTLTTVNSITGSTGRSTQTSPSKQRRLSEGHDKKKYDVQCHVSISEVEDRACTMSKGLRQNTLKHSRRSKPTLTKLTDFVKHKLRPEIKPSFGVNGGTSHIEPQGSGFTACRSKSYPCFGAADLEGRTELDESEKKTKLDAASWQHLGLADDQKDNELRDAREQIRRYAEENTRLKNEVDALATEIYKFKTVSQVSHSPTTSSDDIVLVSSRNALAESITCQSEDQACKTKNARENLDKQMECLENEITEVEEFVEVHKSVCQTATLSSNYSTNMRKSLNKIMQSHKQIYDTSKELIAAIEIQASEICQLRKMINDKKSEMTNFQQTVIDLMEKERDLLESEREKIDEEKSPCDSLKMQIIQLRCGLEAKITELQNEVSLLKRQKIELQAKCSDLEKNNTSTSTFEVDCEKDEGCQRQRAYQICKSNHKVTQATKVGMIMSKLNGIVEALSAENDKLQKETKQLKALLVPLPQPLVHQDVPLSLTDEQLAMGLLGDQFRTGSFRNDPVLENVKMLEQ